MKRKELLKRIAQAAHATGQTVETREGGSHTQIRVGNKVTYVPRHAEINELTAKAILKQIGAQ